MKMSTTAIVAGACFLTLSHSASSQDTGAGARARDSSLDLEEIIVTARRKEERLQDVPTTVNVVTAESLSKLNIRQFEDIQTVVPGLTLGGTTASVRGISFNQLASGSNGTIEFYLNDSPLPATNLFQVMYDIGQVELLRGPQGTLRGRAAPSGSMTVTTHRPDLHDFGGYVDATATDRRGLNFNGAVNLPILTDKLAIRLAGLADENEAGSIRSVNNSLEPFDRSKSGRATIRFEPIDALSLVLTYQKLDRNSRTFGGGFTGNSYTQVESLQATNPGAPASPTFITASDRRAVLETPSTNHFMLDILNLQAQWAFAGQKLNYVGSLNESESKRTDPADVGDFFGPTTPAFLLGYGQYTDTKATVRGHELRLSSEEMLFGLFDYILGAFYEKVDSPTHFTQATPVLIPAPLPGNPGLVATTPISRNNTTKEQSGFGNLTFHLGEATEISGGLRYIEYKIDAGLAINGTPLAAATDKEKFHTTIYSGSIKHNFNDDLMVYGTFGTSWRPGLNVTGDFSLAPSPLERSFVVIPPEKSKSYEIGFKASAFEKRMALNLALFHQDFDNYPWRSPTGVFYVQTALNTRTTPPSTFQQVTPFNFVGGVPVKVNGVEAEWTFAATPQWDIGANVSYAKSEIKNAAVPCNDYFPHDGIPDSSSAVPTVGQIQTATGGDTISACNVKYRASLSPLWSGTAQSEYRLAVSQRFNAYVRGLLTVYGDSQNDPTNAVDDINGYYLLNLYLGLRESRGAWEVSLYGKNVTDTERVLSRSSTPLVTNYNQIATSVAGTTTYRGITFTAPREFGVHFRYAFGSR